MSKVFNIDNRSVLYDIAEEVKPDEDIKYIIEAMYKTLSVSPIKGLGLAAPQIGISKRIIILNTDGYNLQAIINPEVISRRPDKATSEEGCLSFPGKIIKIKRYKMIIVEGFSQYYKPIRLKLRGLDSFVVQHEVDHLNGITIAGKR